MKFFCKYYTYLITNLLLQKQYVGSRMYYGNNIENDKYFGSSGDLKKDIELYGKQNFRKKILISDYTNSEEMLISESEFILKYNTLAPNGYNKVIPTDHLKFHTGGCHFKWSEESKEKIKKYRIGEKAPGWGKTPWNKGIKMTDAQTQKMRKPKSEEHKKNISNAAKMRPAVSIETRNKLSKSLKGKNTGARSQETRDKISKSRLGKKRGPYKKLIKIA